MKFITTIFIITFSLPSLAFEEIGEVERPLEPMSKPERDHSVGSRYIYHDNLGNEQHYSETLELHSEEGEDRVTWKDTKTGCTWTVVTHWFSPPVSWKDCPPFGSGRQNVTLKGNIWPLTKDSQFRFRSVGSNNRGYTWTATNRCKVDSEVRIKTIKGEFDTYKLVCKDPWSTRIRYLSPAEGQVVAFYRKHKRHGVLSDSEFLRWEP